MKNVIDFLFKRHEKLQTSPIMIILLGITVLFALWYFFIFSKSDDTVAVEPAEVEETSFIEKIKGIFSSKDDEDSVEIVQNETENLPSIPSVPKDINEVDREQIFEIHKKDTSTSTSTFSTQLDEAEVDYVGRRDPMKRIVGENNGNISENKTSKNKYADLINESEEYFEGVAINDIMLDNVTYDKKGDNKLRGTFIVEGSIIPDLEVGDYLLELYYIKDLNLKDNTAILEYDGKTFKLGAQKIIDKNTYNMLNGEDVPYNK